MILIKKGLSINIISTICFY